MEDVLEVYKKLGMTSDLLKNKLPQFSLDTIFPIHPQKIFDDFKAKQQKKEKRP